MSTIDIYKPFSKIAKEGMYHGCWSIYEDGTRKLISKCCKCNYQTNDPFWKKAKEVDFSVKTRGQKSSPMSKVVQYFTKTGKN